MAYEALYGANGPKVTLEEYIDLEGGETNTKKWDVKPVCYACGERVFAWGIPRAKGFGLAGQEVTHPHVKPVTGFHHYKHNGDKECPLYSPDDPRFAGLRKHRFDVRVRDRNREILLSPDIRRLNAGVLRKLWNALTRREIECEDRKRLHQIAMTKRLYNMEALGTYPWLLSYFLMGLEKHHRRRSARNGDYFIVTYKDIGTQMLPYRDFEGGERLAEAPKSLAIHFVDEMPDGKLKVGRAKFGTPPFNISETDAYALAGLPLPQRPRSSGLDKVHQLDLIPPPPSFLQGPPV
ncbi:MAG: hypothetical protein PHY92_04280 [Alphaproteobacteria bacterium]|nr:hypothetical protein [Alphaproteobacteria bacterium]